MNVLQEAKLSNQLTKQNSIWYFDNDDYVFHVICLMSKNIYILGITQREK